MWECKNRRHTLRLMNELVIGFPAHDSQSQVSTRSRINCYFPLRAVSFPESAVRLPDFVAQSGMDIFGHSNAFFATLQGSEGHVQK